MLKEKRDLLGQKKEARQAIYNKCLAEKRSRTADETTQWNALKAEIDTLEEEVRFLEEGEREARAAANIPVTGQAGVHSGVAGNTHGSDRDTRDLNTFSLGRVIKRMRLNQPVEGIDAEVMQAGESEARSHGITPHGNLLLPYGLFCVNREGRDLVRESLERRDMTATGTTSTAGDQGGQTIATAIGRLYEALFNRLILRSMGANFMPNMVGDYSMPRMVKGTDPVFKAENAPATKISPTVASETLSPQRLPAYVEVSNQLFLQSEANISQVIQRYLINALSTKFEEKSINGAGHGSNEPLGILGHSGIASVFAGGAASNSTNADGANLIWDDIVALYTAISTNNADFGTMGYLLNPQTVGKLQTTLVADNTAAQFIMKDRNTLNAFNVGISGSVPSTISKGSSGNTLSAVVFGNFNDLTICTWGGLDLLVNPYSLDTTGMTRINAALYGDSGLARPESFSVIKDAKLS